jgi:hypothetical protein
MVSAASLPARPTESSVAEVEGQADGEHEQRQQRRDRTGERHTGAGDGQARQRRDQHERQQVAFDDAQAFDRLGS